MRRIHQQPFTFFRILLELLKRDISFKKAVCCTHLEKKEVVECGGQSLHQLIPVCRLYTPPHKNRRQDRDEVSWFIQICYLYHFVLSSSNSL